MESISFALLHLSISACIMFIMLNPSTADAFIEDPSADLDPNWTFRLVHMRNPGK